jgi:tetratricopeptide (TPR) repeat protein
MVFYKDLSQHQRASKIFNMAIRLKSDGADTYINRGVAYLSRGNNELGCRDAQKACTLSNCKLLEEAKRRGACR